MTEEQEKEVQALVEAAEKVLAESEKEIAETLAALEVFTAEQAGATAKADAVRIQYAADIAAATQELLESEGKKDKIPALIEKDAKAFEQSQKDFDERLAKFLSVVEKKKVKASNLPPAALAARFKINDLRSLAKGMDLSSDGSKVAIVTRLIGAGWEP